MMRGKTRPGSLPVVRTLPIGRIVLSLSADSPCTGTPRFSGFLFAGIVLVGRGEGQTRGETLNDAGIVDESLRDWSATTDKD